jgi:uncharacterized protein
MKYLILALTTLLPLRADNGEQLVNAARKQLGVTVSYDPAYVKLDYPGGDVPVDRGVCTDVIIRSMRVGLSKDLQQLLHEDMKENFSVYPSRWGLTRPDKNIDHRRVPNLQTWFKRQGYQLPLKDSYKTTRFLAGDIVTCTVPPNLPHIMIVSNEKNKDGVPLVIHNIGSGACEEDRLFAFPLTGHYRVK